MIRRRAVSHVAPVSATTSVVPAVPANIRHLLNINRSQIEVRPLTSRILTVEVQTPQILISPFRRAGLQSLNSEKTPVRAEGLQLQMQLVSGSLEMPVCAYLQNSKASDHRVRLKFQNNRGSKIRGKPKKPKKGS